MVLDRHFKKVATDSKANIMSGMGAPTVASDEIAAHLGASASFVGNLPLVVGLIAINRYIKANRPALEVSAAGTTVFSVPVHGVMTDVVTTGHTANHISLYVGEDALRGSTVALSTSISSLTSKFLSDQPDPEP